MTKSVSRGVRAMACALWISGCSKAPSELSRGVPDASADAATVSAPLASSVSASKADLPRAFPEAEGFGAYARGGRGGSVCEVTSLAKAGAGTLAACVSKPEARTVVFRVSGVIPGPLDITKGRLTIAGQTSPAGITIDGGIVCDNSNLMHDCNDIVIRHVRVRGGSGPLLSIVRAHDVLVDHCSFANGSDELASIREAQDLTLQYSLFAEPTGPRAREHGVLIEGSSSEHPLDRITIHHNVFDGVSSHVPKIACDASSPGSNCAGHTLQWELTNNVFWEADQPIGFERCTGASLGNGCPPSPSDLKIQLNLRGNLMVRRGHSPADAPLADPALWAAANDVYYDGNRLQRGVGIRPASGDRPSRHSRFDFPYVALTPNDTLMSSVIAGVGASPRDQMDSRIVSHLTRPVDLLDRSRERADGGDAFRVDSKPIPPPKDSDHDGIPDSWERAHQLDPAKNDSQRVVGDGDAGAGPIGCKNGVSVLECFLNEVAERR